MPGFMQSQTWSNLGRRQVPDMDQVAGLRRSGWMISYNLHGSGVLKVRWNECVSRAYDCAQ